jgi:hypothetical protein
MNYRAIIEKENAAFQESLAREQAAWFAAMQEEQAELEGEIQAEEQAEIEAELEAANQARLQRELDRAEEAELEAHQQQLHNEKEDANADPNEAVQVHRFYSDIDIPRYLILIGAVAKDEYGDTKLKTISYIETRMKGYLESKRIGDPARITVLLVKLDAIFQRLLDCDILYNGEKRIIVCATIDFVMAQPDDFIYGYITEYINASYISYEAGDMSCASGIYERIVTCVLDVAFDVCNTTQMCPPIYKEILETCLASLNSIAHNWEREENASAAGRSRTEITNNVERTAQRRASFIAYCNRARRGLTSINKIEEYADKISYVFSANGPVAFGIYKKKSRKNGKKKSRKNGKKKSRKNGKKKSRLIKRRK